jgi:hypothetical protein
LRRAADFDFETAISKTADMSMASDEFVLLDTSKIAYTRWFIPFVGKPCAYQLAPHQPQRGKNI